MVKPEKQEAVIELAGKIDGAKTIILTDFTGMNVLSISELRRKCREASVEYRVVKNTLTKLAALQTKYGFLAQQIDGPTALAFSTGDELAPVRVISQFRRQYQLPKIKVGIVEGRVLSSREVERLALLPPRQILFGHVAGVLMRPVAMLSFVLNFKLHQLLSTLNELKKKKSM